MRKIQAFENVKGYKEMYGHPDAIHFFVTLTFSNACIFLTIGSIYTKLGDFVKLGLYFMIMWINSC